MVKIKLFRNGKKDEAHYRIVVVEARSKRDGKYTDLLGFYDPNTNPLTFEINREKYLSWLQKGAQPTDTVKKLFEKTNK